MEMTAYERSYWITLTGNDPAQKFARKLQGMCESAGFSKPLKLPNEYSCAPTTYVGVGGNAEALIRKIREMKKYSKIRREFDHSEFDPEYPGIHFEWWVPVPKDTPDCSYAEDTKRYEVHVACIVLTSTPQNRTSCGIHFAAN